MFVTGSARNVKSLQRTCHRCFLSSFGSFGQVVAEEKIIRNRSIKNKNCLWQPLLLTDEDEMCNLYRGPSSMLPTKFQFIQVSGFRRRRFFINRPIRQELLVAAMFIHGSGRNQESLQRTFHRCFLSSVIAFGQVVSEENIFFNRPIRNNNCLWWPCLLPDQDEMCTVYREPSIDASFQGSVHLAKRFQRRRFFQKQINQRKELFVAAIYVRRSRRNEQSLQSTFHICFLSSFSSFG